MSSHQITVTGVLPAPGDAQKLKPARKNFKDLKKDTKQFSLYIRAISKMMKEKEPYVLSWYAIGGIHGLPSGVPWDNANNKPKSGYCAHATVNFPTWHRPYVALFEQALQGYATEAAKEYTTDQEQWLKAAKELRSPYWDWAQNSTPDHEVYRMEKVEIITPQSNSPVLVDNPLLAYKFGKPIHPSFTRLRTDTTIRNPQEDKPNETNIPALEESLKGLDDWLGTGIRTETYKTLTLLKDWKVFSNKRYRPQKGARQLANSIETIHDNVHVAVGGDGHMGDPSYAAFDPIFWLHHTNVDRMLSLWQAINPTVKVYATDGPEAELANKDLAPFWNGATSFYRSTGREVRDWTELNYTYPEFDGLDGQSQEEIRHAILTKVNELYGGVQASPKSFATSEAPAVQFLAAAPASFLSFKTPAPSSAVQASNSFLEWYVRIRSKRFEIGSSYSVLIFLGEPPEHPAQWRTSPALAGIHAEFVNSNIEDCENCREQRDTVTEGFISITEFLKRHDIAQLPESEVDTYLRENIHWRIQKIDGSVLPAEQFQSLEISVLTVPLAISRDDHALELPSGILPTHRNVTDGRAGGRASA